MTSLTLYTATIANRFHWATVATMAPSREAAIARFEANAASEQWLKCAAEERAMWLPEHGDQPEDSAYAYALILRSVDENSYLAHTTNDYTDEIMADTTGQVFFLHAGPNG